MNDPNWLYTYTEARISDRHLLDNSSPSADVPTKSITALLSKVNIGSFPTTLIESNAMKRLITLILSAVLLCPMWAGAQTITTTLEDISWSGSLSLGSFGPIFIQGLYLNCNTITNITLQIQLPSNNSAIIPVSGVYNCSPSDNNNQIFPTPLSGTMVAMSTPNMLATPTSPAKFYNLQLRLNGPATLECATGSASDLSILCSYYTTLPKGWTNIASGYFFITQ